VDPRPHQVVTILGSCLSVCIWDAKLAYGGINHYLFPLWNGEGLASPKFGNIANEKLIERMLALGSNRKNLVAKIFGGTDHISNNKNINYKIGERNVRLAVDMLREEKIDIVNFSVGGNKARKIIYYTRTGDVLMKYVNSIQEQR
jgi:chemotaxis protein CheD